MIYRKFCLSTLSDKNCAKFLQDLAATDGSIVSSYSLAARGNTRKAIKHYSMWFNLGFARMEDLEDFHSRGNKTEDAETYSGLRLS